MRIKINIGGTIFETTEDTLKRSLYFQTCLKEIWRREEIMFVDRSPEIFKHVLCLMRDPTYLYPTKYKSELEFYGIEATNLYTNSLENILNDVVDKLSTMCSELESFGHYNYQLEQTLKQCKFKPCYYCTRTSDCENVAVKDEDYCNQHLKNRSCDCRFIGK